jgi:tetratricopeptide (TPR) repeat protein
VYPRFHFGWSDLRTLRAGRYKYIEAPRPELYDLDKDPQETTNILPQRRALAGQMRAHLRRSRRASRRVPLPPARRRRSIRTLAIGWRRSATSARSSRRFDADIGTADPKDKIELFNLITHARDLSRHNQDSDEAITTLLDVTRRDPKVIDAWFMLGNEYYRKRQFELAIESYKQALALKSDYDLVVINMANAYRQLGKDEEALVGYRRFMELDPRKRADPLRGLPRSSSTAATSPRRGQNSGKR